MDAKLTIIFIVILSAIVILLLFFGFFFYQNQKEMMSRFWSIMKENSKKDNSEKKDSVKEEDCQIVENRNSATSNTNPWKKNHTIFLYIFVTLALTLSVISLVFHFSAGGTMDIAETLVSITAVCAALIVGFQIFNSMEYRAAIKEFDIKHEDAVKEIKALQAGENKTIKRLDKQNTELIKSDGDSSRMISSLLLAVNKPTWAIGWVCRSMKRYSTCYERGGESLSTSLTELKDQCVHILVKCIDDFVIKVDSQIKIDPSGSVKEAIIFVVNNDNLENHNLIIIRALKDIVDYRIMNKKKGSIFIENEEQEDKISKYISLIQEVLTKNELRRCQGLSKMEDEFAEELSRCKKSDSIETLFKELSKPYIKG